MVNRPPPDINCGGVRRSPKGPKNPPLGPFSSSVLVRAGLTCEGHPTGVGHLQLQRESLDGLENASSKQALPPRAGDDTRTFLEPSSRTGNASRARAARPEPLDLKGL